MACQICGKPEGQCEHTGVQPVPDAWESGPANPWAAPGGASGAGQPPAEDPTTTPTWVPPAGPSTAIPTWPAPGPQPPARSNKGRNIAIAVVALVLIGGGVGGAIAATSHHKTNPNSNPPASNQPGGNGSENAVPAGYTAFSDANDGFSVDLPSSWKQIDLTNPNAQAAISQVEANNPNLASVIGNPSKLISDGTKLFAIAPGSDPSGFYSNLNIIVKKNAGLTASDLPQLANALPAEFQKVGATFNGSNIITLNGQQALEATASLPVNDSSGNSITVSETQYYVPINGNAYIITLAGGSADLQTIANSFSGS